MESTDVAVPSSLHVADGEHCVGADGDLSYVAGKRDVDCRKRRCSQDLDETAAVNTPSSPSSMPPSTSPSSLSRKKRPREQPQQSQPQQHQQPHQEQQHPLPSPPAVSSYGLSPFPSASKALDSVEFPQKKTGGGEHESDVVGRPHALEEWDTLAARFRNKKLAFFLDYDGTLTPIVAEPDLAVISENARAIVGRLARKYPTAIVSGRRLDWITKTLKFDHLYYAASHGFQIRPPVGSPGPDHQVGDEFLPALSAVYENILPQLQAIPGAMLENNLFYLSVHFRNVKNEEDIRKMSAIVDEALTNHPNLKRTSAKCVWEIKPQLEWNKGQAIHWLLQNDLKETVPIFIGDDVPDEDGFRVVHEYPGGMGVRVCDGERPTAASYIVKSPSEVATLLQNFCEL